MFRRREVGSYIVQTGDGGEGHSGVVEGGEEWAYST